MGDRTSSKATASLALRILEALKPSHPHLPVFRQGKGVIEEGFHCVFMLYFLVYDCTQKNHKKISDSVVRTKQMYRHGCECSFSFHSVVDQGRYSGTGGCVALQSPRTVPRFPGLLSRYSQELSYSSKPLFLLPQVVFVLAWPN
jgi:hypothetical protein